MLVLYQRGNRVIEPHLPFASPLAVLSCLPCVWVCVSVCSLVFVSGLVNQSPFRQLLAADSTLGWAVCQVSFMLPVSVGDQLVPQVFYVTVSFFHSDGRLIGTDKKGKPQRDRTVQMWTESSRASLHWLAPDTGQPFQRLVEQHVARLKTSKCFHPQKHLFIS